MSGIRYCVLTGVALLAVCALVGSLCLAGLADARAEVAGLDARAVGLIVTGRDGGPAVRWTPSGAGSGVSSGALSGPSSGPSSGASERVDPVVLADGGPVAGTRVEVAYDPRSPGRLLVPGSAALADGDRAGAGLAFVLVVTAGVVLVAGWQLATRRRAARRDASPARVRPIRIQRGLTTRSWLELADGRCVPVHPDPVLAALTSPVTVTLLGNPRRNRFLAARAGGVTLFPSGRVAATQPPGRRIDGSSIVDEDRAAAVAGRFGLLRRLRIDAAQAVPAPVIGLVWVVLLGGGVAGFVAATSITAATGLFRAALRGSDPS